MATLLVVQDKFVRTGGSYPVTAFPIAVGSSKHEPTLCPAFAVQPFIMEEKPYIVLADDHRELMVNVTYLRGKRFEGQCYKRGDEETKQDHEKVSQVWEG